MRRKGEVRAAERLMAVLTLISRTRIDISETRSIVRVKREIAAKAEKLTLSGKKSTRLHAS
jgi:hypothetical protein